MVLEAVVENSVVVVAAVVVLLWSDGRYKSVPSVSVALMRASAREEVKYRFAPSNTLVVRRPREEVASC